MCKTKKNKKKVLLKPAKRKAKDQKKRGNENDKYYILKKVLFQVERIYKWPGYPVNI